MQASSFHIRSENFPVLQQDLDECCNPGTYGKSLVDHLQAKLERLGYEIPFSVAEDFGWWVEIKSSMGTPTHIIVTRSHEESGIADFVIDVDNLSRKWSWKRFRFVDLSAFQMKLAVDVRKILSSDADIEFVADHLDYYPHN